MIKLLAIFFASFFASDLLVEDLDYNLKVTISGMEKFEGNIRIAIYTPEHEFLSEKDILDYRIVPVKSESVTCTFQVKEKGKYAMALIHDVNESGDLEFNWIGWPLEPFGFSNNPRVVFKAPSFDECAVYVEKDTAIEIKL